MNVNFRKAFSKDLKKIKDKNLLNKVKEIIENTETIVENIPRGTIPELSNFKKMSGYLDKYRIRIGNYRIGITIENDLNEEFDTFWFERFIHRKDIYKYFP